MHNQQISFQVFFMAETEVDRHWTFKAEDFSYPYLIFQGIHPVINGATMHFNPGLPLAVAREKPDWVFLQPIP